MKKKALFVANCDIFSKNFGGSQASNRNYKLLKEFFDVDIVNFSFSDRNIEKIYTIKTRGKVYNILNYFIGYAGFLNLDSEKKIMDILRFKEYDLIFLDSSNYGRLALKIKKLYHKTKIITFFHNLEYDFILGAMKFDNIFLKFCKISKLMSTYYNEKLSIKYSDYIITLNKRDTKKVFDTYKGKSNLELPVTLKDNFLQYSNDTKIGKNILFIGALFYANYHGIKWFVENVMPHINKKLLIVGKDFETKKSELERINVEVIGSVDDLTPYYLNASCMVMPIFDGAGMKVKTAEALMYGKTIYGTTEAFEGYDIEYNKVGGLCNAKEEFIEKINNDKNIVFNEYSRKVFLEKYSFESSKEKFKKFLIENHIF